MAKLGPCFTAHLILSHGKIQRLRQYISSQRQSYEQLVLCHYIPIMSQLWLTSHPRSTVALLDPQLLVPAEKFTVKRPMMGLELETPWL